MSNTQALIAEVKSDLNIYADAHLLDEDSMYRDIVLGLKRFGNDLLEIHETVVEVRDGVAQLPENFKVLYFAYLCEPVGYYPETEIHHMQESVTYKERHVRSTEWNECEACCENVTESTIKETLYFKEKKVADYYYNRPRLLALGKTFHKTACHRECRNKLVKDNPNEIIIIGTTLQANFPKGHIYLQFYGLPVDEDGMINIPDTHNGHLEEYLEYRVKRKAAERLIGNNDAVKLSNMLGYFAQQEALSLKKASNEVKMFRLQPRTFRRLSRLNKLESMQYESPYTAIRGYSGGYAGS